MANKYYDFFYETEEGKCYIKALNSLLKDNHRKAEAATDRDLSYAFTQRAKGIREAIEQAASMSTEAKKPK